MQARALYFLAGIPEDLGILQSPLTFLEKFRSALQVKKKKKKRQGSKSSRRRRREEGEEEDEGKGRRRRMRSRETKGGGEVLEEMEESNHDDVDDEEDEEFLNEQRASSDAHLFYTLHLLATLEGINKLHDLTKLIDQFRRSVLPSDDKLRPWQAVMSTKNVFPMGKDDLYILPAQVLQCERNSALGLLLRRIIVASDAFLMDGWTRLWDEVILTTRPQLRSYVEILLNHRKSGSLISNMELQKQLSSLSSSTFILLKNASLFIGICFTPT
jgi:hypothetical protein